MNLRLESKNIRIRLTDKEWRLLLERSLLEHEIDLGFSKSLRIFLRLSDKNEYQLDNFDMSLLINRELLRKPEKKKDPYWGYESADGVAVSLDVDIIPEERR